MNRRGSESGRRFDNHQESIRKATGRLSVTIGRNSASGCSRALMQILCRYFELDVSGYHKNHKVYQIK